MSADLPARLRQLADHQVTVGLLSEGDVRVTLLREAADEIERLAKRERVLIAMDMARDASAARKRNRRR